MLVFARKPGQRFRIGDDIIVEIVRVGSCERVRIGVEAPPDVPIWREEIWLERERDRLIQERQMQQLQTDGGLHE